MRTKKRRLVGCLVVVIAALFAACIAGGPATSTLFEELQITYPNGSSSSWCGTPTVGSSQTCQDVTISPAVGDNYLLLAIDRTSCAQNVWEPVLSTDITDRGYPIACTDGSGTVPEFFTNSPLPTCIPTSYTFTARFTPSSAGSASCVMKAVLMNRNDMTMSTPTVQFNGQGVAPAVGLSLSPTTIDFVQVPVTQTSSPVSFVVKNEGAGAASITVTRVNATWFATPGLGSSFSLSAGSSSTFSVTCQPQTTSEVSGSISFLAMGSGGSASQTLSLACEGINSNIAIDPSPASFASALVGDPPDDITISISSPGGPSVLTDLSLGAASGELTIVNGGSVGSGITIGPGSPHQVTLHYAAETPHPSGLLGTLVVTAQGGSPRNVAITGEALPGKAAVTPGVIDFGPVCADSTASAEFEVYAEEAGSFQLMNYQAPEMPFAVTTEDFTPGVLLRGNRANAVKFVASVSPSEPNPALTSMVTLETNLPSNPNLGLELRAVALPAGVSPTPNRVDFGPNPIKATTFAQKIVLTNCSAAPSTISAVRIVGTNASEFTVVSPSNPLQTVPAMGELEFLVVMNPDTPGAKVAQLEIVHDGGTAIANLDGAAFGPGDLDGGDKGTYYSCSTGGGAGLAPLGLALLLLRRRRRNA
ncbi:MAG: choice-of-anchor D domain-containing protein [Kofleriaceae bacterium]|nr:choice-of-anchor D domain-containing protein [Kofleriaceae bacterium]